MEGIDPQLLAQLLQAGGAKEEKEGILEQEELAKALMQPSAQRYSTPAATGLAGIGDIFRSVAGAAKRRNAGNAKDDLARRQAGARQAFGGAMQGLPEADFAGLYGADEASAPGRAQALARALQGREQLGRAAALSGDPSLAGLGQSLNQGAGRGYAALADWGQGRQAAALKRSLAEAEAKAEAQKALSQRQNKLDDTTSGNDEWTRRNKLESAQAEKRARIMAQSQAQGRDATAERGTVIPGLEKEDGAAPTAQDATKVKASLESARKLKSLGAEMRGLHAKHGTELTGPVATRMNQIQTAIKIEGKNIADLGALSGPDSDLMDSLTGVDTTSVGANLKALVGQDNTQTALEGLDKWADGALESVKKTYGYRDAKPRQPAPTNLNLDSGAAPARAASPQADAALQWAKANPNDPRAAKILQKLGAR